MSNVSNQNYVIYHLHTDDSLLDSCTKYQDYIDKAVADGCMDDYERSTWTFMVVI